MILQSKGFPLQPLIFAPCANIFDKKTAKIAILIHKEGIQMIWL